MKAHAVFLFSRPAATSNPFPQKPQLFSTMLYSLVPIVGLAAVVLFSFWMWRHHKLAYPAALVPTHVSVRAAVPLSGARPLRPSELETGPTQQRKAGTSGWPLSRLQTSAELKG